MGGSTIPVVTSSTKSTMSCTNSEIKNAHIGIYAGNSIGILQAPGLIQTEYTGAANLNVSNSTFENNRTSISFAPSVNTSDALISKSRFICSDILQDQEKYPGEGSLYFISLEGIRGVRIQGNAFETTTQNLTVNKKGTGIKSWDATYTVTYAEDNVTFPPTPIPNTFRNLTYGIDAYSIGGLDRVVADRNIFDRTTFGITLQGTAYDEITNNRFDIQEEDVNTLSGAFDIPVGLFFKAVPYGVFTLGATGFIVSNNEFEGIPRPGCDATCPNATNCCILSNIVGVAARNTGSLGAVVSGNTFTKLNYGVYTQYNNPALRFNCNDFTDVFYGMTFNYMTSGVLADQSSPCVDMANPAVLLENKIIPNNTFQEVQIAPCIAASTWWNDKGHLAAYPDSWTVAPVFYRDNPQNPNLPDEVNCVADPEVNYDVCPQGLGVVYPIYDCNLGIQSISNGNGGGGESALINQMNSINEPMLKQHAENELMHFYLNNGNEAKAMAMAATKTTDEAKLMLSAEYIKNKEFGIAGSLISSVSVLKQKEIDFYTLVLNQKQNNVDLKNMPITDKMQFTLWSGNNLPDIGVDNVAIGAQGILDYANTQSFNRWIHLREQGNETNALARKSIEDSPVTITKENTVEMLIAPNPTQMSTTISLISSDVSLNLSKNIQEKYTIQIFNMQGVLVKQYAVNSEKEVIELHKSDIGSGIFYSILSNGKEILDRQKIVIID